MDTKKGTENSITISYKKSGLMHKAVAAAMAAFFIFYGIPMPTSYAGESSTTITLNDRNQFTPTLTLEQANARKEIVVPPLPIPSGVAIQNPNPLSLSVQGPSLPKSFPISTTPVLVVGTLSLDTLRANNPQVVYGPFLPGTSVQSSTSLPTSSATLQRDGNPQPAASSTLQAGVPSTPTLLELPVPSGWTRAVTNGNYAYRVHEVTLQSGTVMQHLQVMNLQAGSMIEIDALNKNLGDSFMGPVAVSADGQYMMAQSGGNTWNSVTVYWAGNEPVASIPTQGRPVTSIGFSGEEALIAMGDGGSQPAGVYHMDLANGRRVLTFVSYPSVPTGWTRAASNANFAFTTENYWGANNNNYARLKVQDLTTGTVQELYSLQSPPFQYTVMDVSADGSTVYFGTRNNYTTTASGWFRVQKMNDTSQQTDIQGIPSEAGFLANGNVSVTLLTAYRNGTELGNVYTVDHATMQSNLSHIKLVKQADAVLDEGYLIIPERVAYSNHFTVTVYDASQGTDRLVKKDHKIEYNASQAPGGSSGSGTYSLIDAYRTEAGRVLISVGISAVGNADVDYNATFVLDPVTGQQLAFEGVATAVDYAGDIARYSVKHRDGTSETISVDLTTLIIIPPVPSGWTRVAANVNYAYQIALSQQSSTFGEPPVRTLSIMNLVTGAVQAVGIAYVSPNYDVFTDKIDVSPDGSLAIFEIISNYNGYRKIGVRSLDTTGFDLKIQSSRMALEQIEYTDEALLLHVGSDENHVNGGVYRVDLALQQVVFTPNVPSGWTRAASNPNFAFQITRAGGGSTAGITDNRLMLLNLETGISYEVDHIQQPDGILPEVWDVASDGRSLIYSTGTNLGSIAENLYGYTYHLKAYHLDDQGAPVGTPTVIYEVRQSTDIPLLQSIVFSSDSKKATLSLKNSEQQIRKMVLNLETFQIEPLDGWTRAASNANFAYRIVYEGSIAKLMVMNLVTGIEQQVAIADHGIAYPVSFSGPIDISPDGKIIGYGTTQPAYGSAVYVQDLANSAKRTTLSGLLMGIKFMGEALVQISHQKGDAIQESIVDYNSMTVCSSVAKKTDYEVITNGYVYYLLVGSAIVTIPNMSPLHSDTLQATVKKEGAIYFHWLYTPKSNPSNSIYQSYDVAKNEWKYISQADWDDVTLPPLPEGWTRMPTNSSLAFQTQNGRTMLMNLLDGSTKMLASNDITTMTIAAMVQVIEKTHGAAAGSINTLEWVLAIATINGVLKPVVKVRYVVKTTFGKQEYLGTFAFDKNGVMESFGWIDGPPKTQYLTVRQNSIADMYRGLLGREPDPKEVLSWDKTRQALTQIRQTIKMSLERQNLIAQMYSKYLGRAPEKGAAYNWAATGLNLAEIGQKIMMSPERQNKIAQMYLTYLGRAPESGATAGWATTGMSLTEIEQRIKTSPEANARAV